MRMTLRLRKKAGFDRMLEVFRSMAKDIGREG